MPAPITAIPLHPLGGNNHLPNLGAIAVFFYDWWRDHNVNYFGTTLPCLYATAILPRTLYSPSWHNCILL